MSTSASTPTSEAALVADFERTLRDEIDLENPRRYVIRELGGIQGRPDLVSAKINDLPSGLNLNDLAYCLRSPKNARILAILRYRARRRLEYIERNTGMPRNVVKRQIRDLEGVGIVTVHGNSSVSLTKPLPWDMLEIVAYETKLKNWRRALQQAIDYRAFSCSVRIVMPDPGARLAKKTEGVFRSHGIGLISIDTHGRQTIKIKSRKRRPSSRRHFLMAVGTVLMEALRKNLDSHASVSSETI